LTKETGQPILLNATAYEQAQKLLPLNGEQLPNVTIRGKSEAVQVYAVKGSEIS
jgi:class 3 adenylate cyclase